MKPVIFHPAAFAEAQAARTHFAGIQVRLGARFQAEFAAALERIIEHPQMYAAEDGVVRFAPLGRFPYSLVYQELEDRVWVAALAHVRRRPG